MPSPSVQMNQGINLETLEALMDQGSAEEKRSIKNRIAHHHHKAMGLIEQRIQNLEKQKKNQWLGSLFGLFVNLVSQASQFLNLWMPGLGTGVSKAVALLGQINPFTNKAESAELEAVKAQEESTQELSQKTRAENDLQDWKSHELRIRERLSKAQENLERSQEVAVRI